MIDISVITRNKKKIKEKWEKNSERIRITDRIHKNNPEQFEMG